MLPKEHIVNAAMLYLGWPVVALSIGVLIAYRNTKRDQASARTSDWVENALRSSAMIIMVVGLGGALSQILRQTPAVDAIAKGMESTGLPAIFLPFVFGDRRQHDHRIDDGRRDHVGVDRRADDADARPESRGDDAGRVGRRASSRST